MHGHRRLGWGAGLRAWALVRPGLIFKYFKAHVIFSHLFTWRPFVAVMRCMSMKYLRGKLSQVCPEILIFLLNTNNFTLKICNIFQTSIDFLLIV